MANETLCTQIYGKLMILLLLLLLLAQIMLLLEVPMPPLLALRLALLQAHPLHGPLLLLRRAQQLTNERQCQQHKRSRQ
jgi:hypothetical protein